MRAFPVATSGRVSDLLLDSDVFVDHLRGAAESRVGSHRLHYSVVTRAELFAGSSATSLVTTLLSPFRELAVDRAVAERAGRIRRASGVRLLDALIAAHGAGAPAGPGHPQPSRLRAGPRFAHCHLR